MSTPLKLAAVQLRSVAPESPVLEGGLPAAEIEWQRRRVRGWRRPYVDGMALYGPQGEDDETFRSVVQRMAALVDSEKPGGIVLLGPVELDLGGHGSGASSGCTPEVARHQHSRHGILAGDPSSPAAASDAYRLARSQISSLASLSRSTSGQVTFRLPEEGRETRYRPFRIASFTASGPSTLYLVYWPAPDGPLDLEVTYRRKRNDSDGTGPCYGRLACA